MTPNVSTQCARTLWSGDSRLARGSDAVFCSREELVTEGIIARSSRQASRMAGCIPKVSPGIALRRALFALRHPKAIGIWRRGVDYDQYRRLDRPWLKRLKLRTVLDIGANVGQFARLAHAVLPEATIYSFEPLPNCYPQLSGALAGFAGFHAINCAVGDAAGQLDIWMSAHSPSSSFLPMTRVHEAAYPESRPNSRVRVRVRLLDEIANEIKLQDNIFVKIDVQGYEGAALNGGAATLRRAAVVLIETSFTTLYRGQMLFAELLNQMDALGFQFFGNMSQYDDPNSGCPLFADSFFVNNRFVDRIVG